MGSSPGLRLPKKWLHRNVLTIALANNAEMPISERTGLADMGLSAAHIRRMAREKYESLRMTQKAICRPWESHPGRDRLERSCAWSKLRGDQMWRSNRLIAEGTERKQQ
jgi:hypothetical protein